VWVNSRECTAVGTFSTRRPTEGGRDRGREGATRTPLGCHARARASELGGDGFARCGACARVSRASCSLIFFLYGCFVRSRFVRELASDDFRWSIVANCAARRGGRPRSFWTRRRRRRRWRRRRRRWREVLATRTTTSFKGRGLTRRNAIDRTDEPPKRDDGRTDGWVDGWVDDAKDARSISR